MPQEPVSTVTLKRQARAAKAFLRYPRVWNALDRISMPVLVTNGELDQGVPVRNARNSRGGSPAPACRSTRAPPTA